MLGIDGNGTKHPLSLIEGATENGRLTAEIGAIEVRPLASRTAGMVALSMPERGGPSRGSSSPSTRNEFVMHVGFVLPRI